jgi:hypothetical protein
MSDENNESPVQAEELATSRPASGWFDRVLWLGPHVAEARAATFKAGQPGFEFYEMARDIREGAAKIGEAERGSWLVLLLDCEVVELLLRAHLARAGVLAGSAPSVESDLASAQKVPAIEAARGKFSTANVPTLVAMLGADRLATMTRLSDDERKSFAVAVHDFAMDLAEPLDLAAHRLGWALFARWVRVSLAGLVAVAFIWFAASWLLERSSPNLALHRPVAASSTNGYGPDPNKLVDGITDEIAFHSNAGDQQWVVIDLGEVKKFDKIVVYNRPGCCAERAVPLKVEVSDDNQNFKQIAERVEIFDKWKARDLNAEGRYVRLKNTPPNFFHLAEVEIYE